MSTTRPTIEDLSFAAIRDGKVLPRAVEGQLPRCFWNVKSTGDFTTDELLGQKLAFEYIDFVTRDAGGCGILSKIIADFPRPLTQVEHAFTHVVELEMRKGQGGARRVVDRWTNLISQLAEDKRPETVTTAVRIRKEEQGETVTVVARLADRMEVC